MEDRGWSMVTPWKPLPGFYPQSSILNPLLALFFVLLVSLC